MGARHAFTRFLEVGRPSPPRGGGRLIACSRVAALLALAFSVAIPASAATDPDAFITRDDALARTDLVVVSGTWTTQYRVLATPDRTYDMRGFTSTAYPS